MDEGSTELPTPVGHQTLVPHYHWQIAGTCEGSGCSAQDMPYDVASQACLWSHQSIVPGQVAPQPSCPSPLLPPPLLGQSCALGSLEPSMSLQSHPQHSPGSIPNDFPHGGMQNLHVPDGPCAQSLPLPVVCGHTCAPQSTMPQQFVTQPSCPSDLLPPPLFGQGCVDNGFALGSPEPIMPLQCHPHSPVVIPVVQSLDLPNEPDVPCVQSLPLPLPLHGCAPQATMPEQWVPQPSCPSDLLPPPLLSQGFVDNGFGVGSLEPSMPLQCIPQHSPVVIPHEFPHGAVQSLHVPDPLQVGHTCAPQSTMPEQFVPQPSCPSDLLPPPLFGQGCVDYGFAIGPAMPVEYVHQQTPGLPQGCGPCVGQESLPVEFGLGHGCVGSPQPTVQYVPEPAWSEVGHATVAPKPTMSGQCCPQVGSTTGVAPIPSWSAYGPAFAEVAMPDSDPPSLEQELFTVHRYLEDTALMPMEFAQTDGASALQPSPLPSNQDSQIQSVASQSVMDVGKPPPKEVFRTIIRPSTEEDLPFRPAVVRVRGDHTLAALVQENKSGPMSVEWDWGRAVSAIGMKTQKVSQYLRRNKESHASELVAAEIAQAELMYKGEGSKAKTQSHCMNSSAFMLLLLLVCTSRQIAAEAKANALSIAIDLLQVGVQALGSAQDFVGICFVPGRGYLHEPLSVNSQGIVQGLYSFLQKHPGAMWAWGHLMENAFCSYKIASSSSCPTLWDFLVLLLWAKANPATKKIWQNFGQLVWPQALWVCGRALDAVAVEKSRKPIEQLPLLQTAKGKSRRVPWVNKLILLQKMRQIKAHRRNTMESHQDLVPKNAHMVAAEQFICASLYAKKVQQAYEEAFHFTVAWDPSGYDVETLVSIIHSTQAGQTPDGLAAYLPIQNLKPVLKQEVCEEIRALSASNKLTRIQGYAEIRALSHSLKAVGKPLSTFFLGEDVHWRPLHDFEKRVFEDGVWWILDSRTGSKVRQLPTTFSISKTPILCSLSDQGGINRAGLDYLCFELGMSIHIGYDPYHRSWNDVKHSLRCSKGDLWRCLLSYSLLYNVNYGPFGSKQWHAKKQQRAEELLQTCSAHKEPFLSYIPFICQERQIEEPTTPAGREKLLESLGDCNSIRNLGPVVKIMRFYSFFQSSKFFEGEVWLTKLVMLETDKFTVTEGTSYVRSEEAMSVPGVDSKLSDKQQLQQLKAKHGSWGLAPLLITPASFWQKEAIVVLANPCWSSHSWMSKHLLTPTDSAKHTIAKSNGAWKAEICELVLQGFFSRSNLKRLYPFQATSEATQKARLQIHFDFVVNLMAQRASSLSSQYCRPPIRYSNLLSTNEAVVCATQQQMQREWTMLLEFEGKDLEGKHVKSLSSLHCLQGALCRLCFLLNETDCHSGSHEAAKLLKPLIVNFGDTLCVENTHQSAKDNLRESRHNQRSRVSKQCAVLNSRLFQTRKTPHVSIPEIELSLTSVKDLPPFIPSTHPNAHHMRKEFQEMMKYKSSNHFWPSTSAATQFEEVAALEYLLSKPALDAPQLNCLVGKPGSVIVSKDQALVCLVLSRAPSGFLAWVMEPVSDSATIAYKPIPQESALQFHHVQSLDQWLDIPVEPCLHHEHGALILNKVGDPMPLPQVRIAKGLDLTVKEAKEVLFACNVKLPGQPSKAQVYKALIEQFVQGDAEVQKALEESTAKVAEQDEDDDRLSELGELIELLEADTEMQNDPDIRNDQKKIKKRRLLKPKVKEGEMMLIPKRGRGRGRGKGRGKGRGRAMAGKQAKAMAKKQAKAKSQKTPESPVTELPESTKVEEPDEANAETLPLPEAPSHADGQPAIAGKQAKAMAKKQPKAKSKKTPKLEVLEVPESTKVEEPDETQVEEAKATQLETLPLAEAPSHADGQPAIYNIDMDDYVPTTPPSPTSPGEHVPEHAMAEAEPPEPLTAPPEPPEPLTAPPEPPEPLTAPPEPPEPLTAEPTCTQPEALAAEAAEEPPAAPSQADTVAEEPASSQAVAAARFRGPKMFASPATLGRISPPGCTLRLNGGWLAILQGLLWVQWLLLLWVHVLVSLLYILFL